MRRWYHGAPRSRWVIIALGLLLCVALAVSAAFMLGLLSDPAV
jgi:hypothetical protein